MNNIRVTSLCLVVAFAIAPLPIQAQPQGPGANPTARIAALEARVAKLEGNIIADDLIGTYNVDIIATGIFSSFQNEIHSFVIVGTATLEAGGSGSISLAGNGNKLAERTPDLNWLADQLTPGTLSGDFTWSYDNGTLTITPDDDPSDVTILRVAVGGQVLVSAHGGPPRKVQSLMVLTRRP